jgi:hypothetical protein
MIEINQTERDCGMRARENERGTIETDSVY